MAKKYITQLTGTTTPSLTGYTVYDNGTTTNKVSLGTLRQTLVNSGSHHFTGSQFISGDVLVGGADRYYTGQPEVIGAYNSGSFNSMVLRGDSETYLQTYIQNVNSGSDASTDLVVGADNGSEEAHYINLGINSSGNNGEWLGHANDTYLMSVAHDFYIGSFAVSGHTSDIHIFTNGSWDNPQLFISSSSQIGYGKHFLSGLYQHEFSGSVKFDNNTTLSQITNLESVSEKIITFNSPSTGITHNFISGSIAYISGATSDFVINITNVPTTNNRAIGLTTMIEQGSTAYKITGLQINSGGAQSISWHGGTQPNGTINSTDIFAFSLIKVNDTWKVLGQKTTF